MMAALGNCGTLLSQGAPSSGTVSGEQAIGTVLSPSGGFGLDANLVEPYTIVPDGSGNLCVPELLPEPSGDVPRFGDADRYANPACADRAVEEPRNRSTRGHFGSV